MNENSLAKCQVCGDRAVGYNFHGLTCESCKIFFRRHANRRETFRCANGNCVIDVSSRNCCRKCRLEQCFRIGMKKELIDYKYTKKSKENGICLEEYENNTKENSACLDNICLAQNELEKLQEVQNAMSIFIDESKLPVVRIASDLTDAMNVHAYYVRKIIKFCKSIGGFKSLNPDDQLVVLKGFHCDISCIRNAFNFNAKKDGMLIIEPENENGAVFVSLEIFNGWDTKENVMIDYRNFVLSLKAAMENDKVIRDLVIARQLFLPRNEISFPEYIRYHHQMYMHILKLYLQHKYDDEEKAETKIEELIELLSQFDRIKEIKQIMMGELNSDELAQEIVELYNLTKSKHSEVVV